MSNFIDENDDEKSFDAEFNFLSQIVFEKKRQSVKSPVYYRVNSGNKYEIYINTNNNE